MKERERDYAKDEREGGWSRDIVDVDRGQTEFSTVCFVSFIFSYKGKGGIDIQKLPKKHTANICTDLVFDGLHCTSYSSTCRVVSRWLHC